MSEQSVGARPGEPAPLLGAVGILLVGIVAGVAYNLIGLRSEPAWGVAWLAEDPAERLAALPVVGGGEQSGGDDLTDLNDPMALFDAGAGLPEIPALGQPTQIELGVFKRFVDADAVVIIDAREPHEFEEGRIPGSISLPYETASTDPALLEQLETGGRPIVVYCGGGTCELSLKMADELIWAGHERVAVFVGGYPEWRDAGYPIEGEAH